MVTMLVALVSTASQQGLTVTTTDLFILYIPNNYFMMKICSYTVNK